MGVRRGRLTAMAFGSVAVGLVGRVVVRDDYVPGFDFHGASHGLYALTAHGLFGAVGYLWSATRSAGAPFPYTSLVYALLPAVLTEYWPWEWWPHVVTFVFFLVTLALLRRAAGVPRRDAAVVLLAWGASPALLSFSVAGMPWISGCLPHALALWIVLDPRLRRRWLVNVALCLVTSELIWHVYELGKSVSVVFVLAALVLPRVPLALRLVWLGTAAFQVTGVFLHPSQHVAAYGGITNVLPSVVVERLAEIGRMLFVSPWLDLPVLLVAALLCALRPTRTRVFLVLLLLGQVALVLSMTLRDIGISEVRPRRFTLVEFYALAVVVSLWGEPDARRLRRVVLAVLLAGNVWALADFVEFARTPFEPGRSGSVWTLPFVHSQLDYMIWPDRARWVTEMAARADAGETILLVYGLGAYNENFSNPDGVLEHLYVHLGHERFVQHVIVFSSDQCHYGCVPVRPMSELGAYLDALQAGGPERWANAVGYRVLPEEWDSETFRTEREQVLSALEARFVLLVDSPPTASVTRFRLEPRSASSP